MSSTSTSQNASVQSKEVHIVIIGAGIAGLAAAERLLGNSDKTEKIKVTIFEATSRAGGRIQSVPFGNGILEQGATWIHGIEDNPVYKCIADKNIVGIGRSSSRAKGQLYCYADGQSLSKDLVQEVEGFFDKTIEKVEQVAQNGQDVDCSRSVGDFVQAAFDEFILKKPEEQKSIVADILRSCVNRECSYNGCDSVCDLMLRDHGEYQEMDGDWPVFPKGYSQVIDTLLKKLPEGCVVLNTPVKCVHWNQQDTQSSDDLERGQSTSGGLKVELANGDCIPADHVIVTVSLGVLKEHHHNLFQPCLPREKQSVIDRLGFGTVNNISLQFDSQFWRKSNKDFIRLMWRDERKYAVRKNPSQIWFKKIFTFYESPHNPDVLVCWLAGSEARQMESICEDEVIHKCTDILRHCFSDETIPKPKAVLRTQWYSNPYTRGSYSFVAVGSEGADIDTLAEPLTVDGVPLVLFAGEATNRHYYSTTHGAMMSGYREADRILNLICNK